MGRLLCDWCGATHDDECDYDGCDCGRDIDQMFLIPPGAEAMSEPTKTYKDIVWVYTANQHFDDSGQPDGDFYVEHTPDGMRGEGDWLCDTATMDDAEKIAAALNSASRHAERDELLRWAIQRLNPYLPSCPTGPDADLLARFAALEKEEE
jgi:hypothetical protein